MLLYKDCTEVKTLKESPEAFVLYKYKNECGNPAQLEHNPLFSHMVCLGVEVDSEHFTLSVTETRVKDLLSELSSWSSREFYTLKQLQSLLGKLSFIANVIT